MENFLSFKQRILDSAQSIHWEKFFELVKLYPEFSSRMLEIVNKHGDTIVHLSSKSGHLDIIKYCRDQYGETILKQRNSDGKTPLHIAAHASQLQCVEYLLSCNVPVDALKRSDWTPLMLACTKSNLDIIKALLDHGANVNCRNKDGWTAFHIACREGYASIIKHLLDYDHLLWKTQSNNGRTPLHTAALHGRIDTVKLLLNTNHDKDVSDSCGTTPLMDAVSGNHHEIIEILTENEVSIEKTDLLGRNVLHLAAQADNLTTIIFLIEKCRFDINSRTIDGLTALHFAVKGGALNCVLKLLELGADYKLEDHKGRKALDYSTDENISSNFYKFMACNKDI